MSTFTQILYQIVFGTKNHEPTMIPSGQDQLYRYIYGFLKNKKCHVYRINGVEEHLHIITHVHPTNSISTLLHDLKLSSHFFIDKNGFFPDFTDWQVGYSAFTYSISAKNNLINYVKNQKPHHGRETFKDELRRLLKENQVDFDEKYFFDF